ncbi:MAG: zinc-dependent alcohol dehydrogenase family protein [Aeromicrobium sp.]
MTIAVPETMRAWSIRLPGPIATHPLLLDRRDVPTPGRDEVLVRVSACGVCRTDVHLAEGDLPVRRHEVVPGHQVVGEVVRRGEDARRFAVGERIGIAWLRRTCQRCGYCRSGRENLCPSSQFTGWDADGGFAEYCVVPDAYAYRLPESLDDVTAAPLLCAGIIGYRALRRTQLPPGGRLGIYGFGSSAHLISQVAMAQGAEVWVMTRGVANRELARSLGATFVGDADARPPGTLDAAIVFAPAGELVPRALRALSPGGAVVLAGIHMSDIPQMDYADCLFGERDLRSVTASTRQDGDELLAIAGRIPLVVHTTVIGFDDIGTALADLRAGRVSGSVVAVVRSAERTGPESPPSGPSGHGSVSRAGASWD